LFIGKVNNELHSPKIITRTKLALKDGEEVREPTL